MRSPASFALANSQFFNFLRFVDLGSKSTLLPTSKIGLSPTMRGKLFSKVPSASNISIRWTTRLSVLLILLIIWRKSSLSNGTASFLLYCRIGKHRLQSKLFFSKEDFGMKPISSGFSVCSSAPHPSQFNLFSIRHPPYQFSAAIEMIQDEPFEISVEFSYRRIGLHNRNDQYREEAGAVPAKDIGEQLVSDDCNFAFVKLH